MTEKLKQIIKEEVMKLPKEKQEAINAFDWIKALEEIGSKFSFNEKEITDFQVETLLILIGFEYPESYLNNIEINVGITKEKANQITKEAYQKIFVPINDIFIENIKKSGKHKNANAEQNLNFILSGGDYSAFIIGEERSVSPTTTLTLADIKANAQKTNIPINTESMTDIKSKFVI